MATFVGLLTVDLRLPEAQTLKDKRQILQSLLVRAANQFSVSVAEVGRQDNHHQAQLAAACVANSAAHCEQVLDGVLGLWQAEPRIEVSAAEREIL
ncbi:MAG TPA: DUF503 domain-containing protein [Armatimonadota bacterium]|jgi:hypothetical protein